MNVRKLKDWDALYAAWRRDILRFAEEGMGYSTAKRRELTAQQRELLQCVQDETLLPIERRKKRITVKSGQGTGKTAVEVIIAMWRTLQFVGARTYVTAPTQHQLNGVWLTEARQALEHSHPLLKRFISRITNKQIIFGNDPKWRIELKSTSKPENFQGLHQEHMTIIVDEASGVDREIIRVIKGTLTNADNLLVAAGNPNTRECAFFDMFHKPSEANLWHRFTFNSERSPIVDQVGLQRLAQEFGTNSDVYRVRVLGEFPLADPNCVMSSEDLWACTGTSMVECSQMKQPGMVTKAIGIDFARFGSDESVIYRRSGLAVVEQARFSKTEPLDVVEKAMQMQKRAGWKDSECWYVCDAGGMGQGVLGVLHRNGKRVHEFHTQHTSSRPDYANKMTEAYFGLAKLARERRLHLPDDEILVSQLSSRLYKTDPKGKLLLEKKDEYMKRMEGQSPDRADALAMTFYDAVMVRAHVA